MPMADSSDGLNVVHLGLVPYAEGLRLQERLRDAVEDGRLEQTLLLLERIRALLEAPLSLAR